MFFDMNYLLLVMIPTLILSGAAQYYVQSQFKQWSAERNGSGLTGPQVARRIMQNAGMNVSLEASPGGEMSDHYDPSSHTVRMSPTVASEPSIASMAIVAHELGHAQQHSQRSALIAARSFLLPAVKISPQLAYGLIFAGVIFQFGALAWLGIAFFGVSVLFMLLTLPVEFDASRRGLKLLEQSGLFVADDDRTGAQKVLTAAALTYVAAAVTAVLQLLYYVSLVSRSSRR